MSKSIYLIAFFLVSSIFSGCAMFTPKPPVQNINVGYATTDINGYVRESLLKQVLQDSFSRNTKFYLEGNCLKCTEGSVLSYCYKISGNTLTASYGGSIGGFPTLPGRLADPLKEARNKIEQGFHEKYTQTVNGYLQFKKEYSSNFRQAREKANNLQIETIDTTKILPTSVLKTIQTMNDNKQHITVEPSSLSENQILNNYLRSLSYHYNQILRVVYKNPVNSYKRYQFAYKNIEYNQQEWSIQQVPKKITLVLDSMLFNFMPENIYAADNNVGVTINTSSSVNNVTVQNGLKKFITINTISVYYNGEIESREIHLKIPPLGIFKTSFSVNKSNRHIALKSKNQKVEVGTAIEYTIVDTGEKKSLYKTKKLSQFDF